MTSPKVRIGSLFHCKKCLILLLWLILWLITICIWKLGTFLWHVAQSTSNKCPSLVYICMSVEMQMTDDTILTVCCHWSDNAWCYTLTTQQKCILLKCCILRSLQVHTLKKKLSRISYSNSHSIRFFSFTSMVISISIDYGHINATSPCPWTWNAFLSILVSEELAQSFNGRKVSS